MKKALYILVFLFIIYAYAASAVGTHLNITMEEKVYKNTTFAKDFYLTTNVSSCYINGTLNITNPGLETVSDIYLRFTNTDNMMGNFTWDSGTKFGDQVGGSPGTAIIIHIPSLRTGNYSTYFYSVNCTDAPPPLNISTLYTNFDHGFNRKVLAGHNWTINQRILNYNNLKATVNNINISIKAVQVPWNSSVFNFSLEDLFPLGDYGNVVGNGTSHFKWWWTPNGGTLTFNQSRNITYRVRAPYSVPFTASYQAIFENISYSVGLLISNLSLTEVNATSAINFSFEKRITQPADNELDHNVTYEIRPKIGTNLNITYDIKKVTLWVTQNLDPTNSTAGTVWGPLSVNYTNPSGGPMKEINISTTWGNSSYFWRFNFTDGTNSSYPPPIVWMQPEFAITNKYGQIMNYTTTRSGQEIFIKYIYVIHGYWLEVSKNVSNIGEDQYRVDIKVENIGNGWTPQYEMVTVYDFIPNDFQVWGMGPAPFKCPTGSYCTNLSVGSPGSDYYGMSYKWDIPWKGTMNSSLGPKTGPEKTGPGNYSWNVTYKVNGTGEYKVSDLYIVGLDPLKVEGAGVSPVISVITGLQSYSKEILYLGIVAFLIVVNVTNLVITNKINRKLDETKEAGSGRKGRTGT